MNTVGIDEAISSLVERPFEGREFPFAFLQAFGNKGASNNSDVGWVLQRNNIRIKVCPERESMPPTLGY